MSADTQRFGVPLAADEHFLATFLSTVVLVLPSHGSAFLGHRAQM